MELFLFMHLHKNFIICLILAQLMSCGQKGPLYLPKQSTKISWSGNSHDLKFY